MNDDLTKEGFAYIVGRLLENAKGAIQEHRRENTDYSAGREIAYYEMLDVVKSELEIRDIRLSDYGLDVDLEAMII